MRRVIKLLALSVIALVFIGTIVFLYRKSHQAPQFYQVDSPARMTIIKKTVAVGKLSGAVGTSAHLSPKIEAYVCKKLGLRPTPIATQVIQRDIHAEFIGAIAQAFNAERPDIDKLFLSLDAGQVR